MKFLAVFFLVGIALASAFSVTSYEEIEIDDVEELDFILRDLLLDEQNRVTRLSPEDELREYYDKLLQRAKETVESGRFVEDRIIIQLRNIRQLLYQFLDEFDQKTIDVYHELSGRAKEYFEIVLEKLGIQQRYSASNESDFSKLARQLKEQFEETVQSIKDAFENGRSFQDGLEKLRQIIQKLRNYRVDLGERGKELVRELKERVREYVQELRQKLAQGRYVNFENLLRNLRERVRNGFDMDAIRSRIEEVFGEGNVVTEYFLQMLKDRGSQFRERILNFIDRLLGEEDVEKYYSRGVYEEVKEFFRDLQIDLEERFYKFGEYVKDKYEDVLVNSRDRVENLRQLARQFINDFTVVRRDVAEQAEEFFYQYKEDLGYLYEEVRERVREIVSRS